MALQPSLGHYFARVNSKWREGYKVQTTNTGHYVSDPALSHVVVVSISGAYNDYQVLLMCFDIPLYTIDLSPMRFEREGCLICLYFMRLFFAL